ncbi:MAG: hypothetical protein QOC77_1280 [Thermoleophilaceae bacterium]|jgi:hypothetical protein|nr:hypothetical protein [Thermoleophilaceae bacterium]
MGIQGEGGTKAATTTQFCTECGTVLPGGQFCPGCGHQTDAAAAATPFPRHEAATMAGARFANGGKLPPVTERAGLLDEIAETQRLSATPQPIAPPRPRWPVVAAGALLVAAIAAAAVILLSGSSDSGKGTSAAAAYSSKVATAFKPVDRANQRLSSALASLNGSGTGDTPAALARARSATSGARGALGALTVPAGSQQLTTSMRQALDREDTYLTAVGNVLAQPASPGVAQLQGLAGNLTSSLEAVGAPITGAAQNVTGADQLVNWAQKAKLAAARKGAHQRNLAGTPSADNAAWESPSQLAVGRDCGGVHAGPHTTCAFARNVQQAYNQAPGGTASVEVHSPQTGLTYTMDCRPAGSGVTCSGGNNASVTW